MNDIRCSRAGCHDPAHWQVIWRNPRIHTDGREKVWLACDEHVAYLRGFVAARDFPVRVSALTGKPELAPNPDAEGRG